MEDIEENGQGAMMKYMQNEEVMSKLGKKFQEAMKDPQLQVGGAPAAACCVRAACRDFAGGRRGSQGRVAPRPARSRRTRCALALIRTCPAPQERQRPEGGDGCRRPAAAAAHHRTRARAAARPGLRLPRRLPPDCCRLRRDLLRLQARLESSQDAAADGGEEEEEEATVLSLASEGASGLGWVGVGGQWEGCAEAGRPVWAAAALWLRGPTAPLRRRLEQQCCVVPREGWTGIDRLLAGASCPLQATWRA